MNLLFDLDGTLADPLTAFASSIHFAFDQFGLARPDLAQLRRCIGPPLTTSLPELLGPGHLGLVNNVMATYREHHAREGIYAYRFYEGAAEALADLQGDFALFLATSKPLPFVKTIFRHFDFEKYFVRLHGAELSGVNSEKPELIAHILKSEGIRAAETVMIGDRLYDVAGARANSLRSIGVTWGFGSAEELCSAGADHVCEDFSELRRLCRRLAAGGVR